MHELGIVFYIIDDVEEVVEANELTTVSSVTLELGKFPASCRATSTTSGTGP